MPKAAASAAVISKHLRTLDIPTTASQADSSAHSPPLREGSVGGGKGGVQGVYYKRSNGCWEHLDFGTTATCCMGRTQTSATLPPNLIDLTPKPQLPYP